MAAKTGSSYFSAYMGDSTENGQFWTKIVELNFWLEIQNTQIFFLDIIILGGHVQLLHT